MRGRVFVRVLRACEGEGSSIVINGVCVGGCSSFAFDSPRPTPQKRAADAAALKIPPSQPLSTLANKTHAHTHTLRPRHDR